MLVLSFLEIMLYCLQAIYTVEFTSNICKRFSLGKKGFVRTGGKSLKSIKYSPLGFDDFWPSCFVCRSTVCSYVDKPQRTCSMLQFFTLCL